MELSELSQVVTQTRNLQGTRFRVQAVHPSPKDPGGFLLQIQKPLWDIYPDCGPWGEKEMHTGSGSV